MNRLAAFPNLRCDQAKGGALLVQSQQSPSASNSRPVKMRFRDRVGSPGAVGRRRREMRGGAGAAAWRCTAGLFELAQLIAYSITASARARSGR